MDSGGLLSLKWNNHSSTFFHVLETIRKKELYSDVTIACDGKFFSVHKLVLSTCSEYFQEMFEKTNCKHPVIVLKDINHKDLESLLNYMYIGEVNVIQAELSSLIKAAECLKVKGLAVPDEPPPQNKRSVKRQSEKDEGSVAKKSKRNLNSIQKPVRNSFNAEREEEMNASSHTTLNPGSDFSDNSNNDQTSFNNEPCSQNFETVVIKTEREEPSSGTCIDDNLPPVSKFEFEGSPADATLPSLSEEDKEPPYLHHHPSADNSLNHTIPSTSQFSEDSTNWGSEVESLGGRDKERVEEGSYDLTTYNLNNPQGKSQMLPFSEVGGSVVRAGLGVPPPPSRYMERKSGGVWRCVFPDCAYEDKKSNLATHIRMHTGDKPFACFSCPYRTTKSSNLYRHMSTKHSVFPHARSEEWGASQWVADPES